MGEMTYKVVTECTAITEYMIEANSAEEAENKFWDGQYDSERITDYRDENIDTVDEVRND